MKKSQPSKIRMFVVRHGETIWNERGVIQGQSNNGDLTEKGVKQSIKVSDILRENNINLHCFYSDLSRAEQTFNIVEKSKCFLSKEKTSDLRETDLGVTEGVYFSSFVDNMIKNKNLQQILGEEINSKSDYMIHCIRVWEVFAEKFNDGNIHLLEEHIKECKRIDQKNDHETIGKKSKLFETTESVRERMSSLLLKIWDKRDTSNETDVVDCLVISHGIFLNLLLNYLDCASNSNPDEPFILSYGQYLNDLRNGSLLEFSFNMDVINDVQSEKYLFDINNFTAHK